MAFYIGDILSVLSLLGNFSNIVSYQKYIHDFRCWLSTIVCYNVWLSILPICLCQSIMFDVVVQPFKETANVGN